MDSPIPARVRCRTMTAWTRSGRAAGQRQRALAEGDWATAQGCFERGRRGRARRRGARRSRPDDVHQGRLRGRDRLRRAGVRRLPSAADDTTRTSAPRCAPASSATSTGSCTATVRRRADGWPGRSGSSRRAGDCAERARIELTRAVVAEDRWRASTTWRRPSRSRSAAAPRHRLRRHEPTRPAPRGRGRGRRRDGAARRGPRGGRRGRGARRRRRSARCTARCCTPAS